MASFLKRKRGTTKAPEVPDDNVDESNKKLKGSNSEDAAVVEKSTSSSPVGSADANSPALNSDIHESELSDTLGENSIPDSRKHTFMCKGNEISISFDGGPYWKTTLAKILALAFNTPSPKVFTALNGDIAPVPVHPTGKVNVDDTLAQEFIVKSVSDGIRSAINLATVNPKDLTTSKMFLKHKAHGTLASIFYITGYSTHSALLSAAGQYEVYSLHVQPLELTWSTIIHNIATAFSVPDVYVKTFWKGIEFRMAFARATSENSSSPARSENTKSNFPVRAAAKVLPRDGRAPFELSNIRNLPSLEDEILDDTPVLVTFTVQLTNWKPKQGDKDLCDRHEKGGNKSLNFYIQEVVLMGEGESYASVDSLFENDA